MRRVARKAIEHPALRPGHWHDLTKREHATEDCAQACYDCLLSYGNQWDHQHLDRHSVIGLLQTMTQATLEVAAATGEDRAELLARLEKESNSLERQFLRFLSEHGYRLPDTPKRWSTGTTFVLTSPITPRRQTLRSSSTARSMTPGIRQAEGHERPGQARG